MIDPDIIYAQIGSAKNRTVDFAEPLYHNMYEIVLTAHWFAVGFDMPGKLRRDKLAEVAAYVVCRDTGPSPDLFLSFHSFPNEPDIHFGYGPDVYNALMSLSPSNRFYKDLV